MSKHRLSFQNNATLEFFCLFCLIYLHINVNKNVSIMFHYNIGIVHHFKEYSMYYILLKLDSKKKTCVECVTQEDDIEFALLTSLMFINLLT